MIRIFNSKTVLELLLEININGNEFISFNIKIKDSIFYIYIIKANAKQLSIKYLFFPKL